METERDEAARRLWEAVEQAAERGAGALSNEEREELERQMWETLLLFQDETFYTAKKLGSLTVSQTPHHTESFVYAI